MNYWFNAGSLNLVASTSSTKKCESSVVKTSNTDDKLGKYLSLFLV